VSQQPAYPVFFFEGQKVPYPVSSFLPDIKLSWRNLSTVNMVEWQAEVAGVTFQTPTPCLFQHIWIRFGNRELFNLRIRLLLRLRLQ